MYENNEFGFSQKDNLRKNIWFWENFKKFILHIYLISLKNADRSVTLSNLQKSIGITRRNINKNITKLVCKKFVEINKIGKNKYIKLIEKAEVLLKGILSKLLKYKNIETIIPRKPEFYEIHRLINLSNSIENQQELKYMKKY